MNKRKKTKIMGLIIVMLILLTIATGILVYVKTITNTDDTVKSGVIVKNKNNKSSTPILAKTLIDDNGWDIDIISNITTESVPIPSRFQYHSGNIETGTILEDELGRLYLWVPYNENVIFDSSEYYKNIQENYIDSDVLKSIKKYNGFFVMLNMNISMETLKDISEEDYQSYAEGLLGEYADGIIQTHILNKVEIEQISNYINSKNFNIANNEIGIVSSTITPYSSLKSNTYSEDYENITLEPILSNYSSGEEKSTDEYDENSGGEEAKTLPETAGYEEDVDLENDENSGEVEARTLPGTAGPSVYMYKNSYYTEGVPIPEGYKFFDNSSIITIQDERNKNLEYIWVPLEASRIDTVKSELRNLYENYTDKDGEGLQGFEEGFEQTSEEIPQELRESIEQYGGFFVSEAELSYDTDGNLLNKARGMLNSSVIRKIHKRKSNRKF